MDEPIDGIDVRIHIAQPLLDWRVDIERGEFSEPRLWCVDSIKRKAARPDVRVREVAIHVQPPGLGGRAHSLPARALMPKRFIGCVVVVSLDNQRGAGAHRQQIANVLAGVMTRRTPGREFQSEFALLLQTKEIAAFE